MYNDYINQHSRQDASRLNGAYGLKEGVNILPESRGDSEVGDEGSIPVEVVNKRDSLGADTMLWCI